MVKLSFYKQIHEIGQQNTYYLGEMIWTNYWSRSFHLQYCPKQWSFTAISVYWFSRIINHNHVFQRAV